MTNGCAVIPVMVEVPEENLTQVEKKRQGLLSGVNEELRNSDVAQDITREDRASLSSTEQSPSSKRADVSSDEELKKAAKDFDQSPVLDGAEAGSKSVEVMWHSSVYIGKVLRHRAPSSCSTSGSERDARKEDRRRRSMSSQADEAHSKGITWSSTGDMSCKCLLYQLWLIVLYAYHGDNG
ncbi:unnamed protein product [Soboliphyme baturini]|uniref:SMN domain-containing protein n=1 Tax=Soboliphyme baturini TaxID=241478 RepID=A0A183IGW4_9BILA|nr:unnamed protein product [Soboliphyme baturini]